MSATQPPNLIPVLDLLGGVVVRGVAGERSQYRPIESRIADSPDPLTVAKALRQIYGLKRLYVADLDGILHNRPNQVVFKTLLQAGFELCVDAGVRTPEQARQLLESGVHMVVAALETSAGPETLRRIATTCGPDRLAFSLDLKSGQPLIPESSTWAGGDPLSIAGTVCSLGIPTLIVLDLADVGCGGGLSTLPLCREINRRYPDCTVWTGGGLRDADDLTAAAETGVSGLLVASALHSGALVKR